MWDRSLNVFLTGKQSEVFKHGRGLIGLGLHRHAWNSHVKQSVRYLSSQVRGMSDPRQWGWIGNPLEGCTWQKWMHMQSGMVEYRTNRGKEKTIRL